jgi:hypothetical protein
MKARLTNDLEPILGSEDPRPKLSAYHDMPYAIFHYSPHDEFELRALVTGLQTRLENLGKRVHRILLSKCLDEAMRSQQSPEAWYAAERAEGAGTVSETVHAVLAQYAPLTDLVAAQMPEPADPLKDIVFILRAGALFPVYRVSTLLEQIKGRIRVPTVLFYPGDLDGAAGLRFMGVLDAEHNYRPKIF